MKKNFTTLSLLVLLSILSQSCENKKNETQTNEAETQPSNPGQDDEQYRNEMFMEEQFINNDKNHFISVEKINSLQFHAAKAKADKPDENIVKTENFDEVKRLLKGVVEFNDNKAVKKIRFRNGNVFEGKDEFVFFIAYYPNEDILLCEGEPTSDVSFNLKNGKGTEETGNPALVVTSPQKKLRMNSYDRGQDCYSHFIERKINNEFVRVKDLDIEEKIMGTGLCVIGDAFWFDESTLFLAETLDYRDKDAKKLYFKVKIREPEPAPIEEAKSITDFLPKGYKVFEKVYGDLNKDGLEDCVIIIKGTDKRNFVQDEYRGKLDRNRRGIIVVFGKKDGYVLAVKNYDCFSSENEDGGVYFAPELSIEVKKRNLYVHYGHGRYGYWRYTFRYQNSDFELIGYDSSDGGAVVNSGTSINYLTRKKITKVNTNANAEGGDEVFKETVTRINVIKLIRLSEIKDFDEPVVSEEQ